MKLNIFRVKRRVREPLIFLCCVQYQYFPVSDLLLQTFVEATDQSLWQAEDGRDALISARQQEDATTIEDVLIAT